MRWTWVLLGLLACGDPKDKPADAAIDSVIPDQYIPDEIYDPNMPQTLAETGLCIDAGCTQINSGIYTYKPRFELWSDAATKRRWIYLPSGTHIDTTDMDHWKFPQGTKLWKEFTRGTTRVETRLEWKVGAGDTQADWFYAGYVWNQTQDATHWAEFGEQDANGTAHDVPSKTLCRVCHENNKPSRVIGFSAIQLDFDGASGDLDLADVIALGWLSAPPTVPSSGPYFPFPTPDSAYTTAALGYMHANCGHCHNPNSAVASNTPVRLQLTVGALAAGLDQTAPYQTAVGATTSNVVNAHDTIVKKQHPEQSVLIDRFEAVTTPSLHMPAAGTEDLDTNADTLLKDWITNIP